MRVAVAGERILLFAEKPKANGTSPDAGIWSIAIHGRGRLALSDIDGSPHVEGPPGLVGDRPVPLADFLRMMEFAVEMQQRSEERQGEQDREGR